MRLKDSITNLIEFYTQLNPEQQAEVLLTGTITREKTEVKREVIVKTIKQDQPGSRVSTTRTASVPTL